MSKKESLEDLAGALKRDAANAVQEGIKIKEETVDPDLEAVKRVLDKIPAELKRAAAQGATSIDVMQLDQHDFGNLPSYEPWEFQQEHQRRVEEALGSCSADGLRGVARKVFKACQDAGLNPSVTSRYLYYTNIPFIIIPVK